MLGCSYLRCDSKWCLPRLLGDVLSILHFSFNNNTSFTFNLLVFPHDDPTYCQTHRFMRALPGRISIIPTLVPQSALSSFPRLLHHMPTHATAQAHVIWNCIFSSLPPLSVSHMPTCACTPRTRLPFELSWQLSPAPLSSPSSSPSPFSPLSSIQMKNMLLSRQQWNLCSLRGALRHHLRVTDEIAFNRWLGR